MSEVFCYFISIKQNFIDKSFECFWKCPQWVSTVNLTQWRPRNVLNPVISHLRTTCFTLRGKLVCADVIVFFISFFWHYNDASFLLMGTYYGGRWSSSDISQPKKTPAQQQDSNPWPSNPRWCIALQSMNSLTNSCLTRVRSFRVASTQTDLNGLQTS